MPGSFMSSTNLPSPVRSLRSSFLFKGYPVHNAGSSLTSFVSVDNPHAASRILSLRLGSDFSSTHLLRGGLDRLHDVYITSAPAKIPVDPPANLLFSRVGISL